MRILAFILVISLLSVISCKSHASEDFTKDDFQYNPVIHKDYKCTIADYYSLSANGVFEETEAQKALKKDAIGKIFTIKRKSGVVTGYIPNDYFSTPQVLNFGSSENSYNVLTVSVSELSGNATVYHLLVEEFVSTKQKPFKYSLGDDTLTGLCEHF